MDEKNEKLTNIITQSTDITNKQWTAVFNEIGKYSETEQKNFLTMGPNIVWYNHEKYALKSFFIDHDISAAKQHFYTCGMLDIYQTVTSDAKILSYGLDHFAYALLSDHIPTINRYANLSYNNYQKDISSGRAAPSFIMQCLIKEDHVQFSKSMDIMKNKTVKKYPVMQPDLQYYEGIAEKNKQKIESAL